MQTQEHKLKPLPSISVVLCCHNSAKRLPETLRYLERQEMPEGLEWEILVVDNASSDDTASLIHQFASQHPHLTVRLVNEARLGQTYARHSGIAQARMETILFVDDDNWLAPDYVALVAETLAQNPEVDALGGMSTACCEGPEPSWLSRYQGWYAVTGRDTNPPGLRQEPFLWTAGAAYRRSILDRIKSLDLPLLLSGRRGDTLDGGEDAELSQLIRLAGGRMYRHTGMYFQHYLPAGRLTWEYLGRLRYAGGFVSVKLDAYRSVDAPSIWPQWILQSWGAQITNVALQILRYRLMLWQPWISSEVRCDRVSRLAAYRGRFDALKLHRAEYRDMVGRTSRPAQQRSKAAV